jgi:hypothetical protein
MHMLAHHQAVAKLLPMTVISSDYRTAVCSFTLSIHADGHMCWLSPTQLLDCLENEYDVLAAWLP